VCVCSCARAGVSARVRGCERACLCFRGLDQCTLELSGSHAVDPWRDRDGRGRFGRARRPTIPCRAGPCGKRTVIVSRHAGFTIELARAAENGMPVQLAIQTIHNAVVIPYLPKYSQNTRFRWCHSNYPSDRACFYIY
jgi:hypothetical protein